MAQRRAGPGRRRDHRGDAGNDRDFDIGSALRLDRLEQGCGHREHAGIARGHQRDRLAFRRQPQGVACAVELFPVVGRVGGLAAAQRDPREIRPVTHQMAGFAQRVFRGRRAVAIVARPQTDDMDAAAHDAVLAVGTRTREK